jgi:16S rRNA (cytosine1402-N4)-methyltransferase
MDNALHVPVALSRCLDLMAPGVAAAIAAGRRPIIIDATLGLGGHASAALARFPEADLIGIDRDQQALDLATARIAAQGDDDRFHPVRATYDQISEILQQERAASGVSAILMDLGVSSMQLDDAERGFAYSQTAPLDMRMDQSQELTAQLVIDTYSRSELIRILREYSEEKFAPRIADFIISRRGEGLRNTKALAELVKDAIPAAARRTGGNPAKRTFQALRIEVNRELSVLEAAMPQAIAALASGGRLVVMAYQSLEDKIVKRAFTAVTELPDLRGLPIQLGSADYRLVFKGSQGASDNEIAENPRAASMRLRALEKIGGAN